MKRIIKILFYILLIFELINPFEPAAYADSLKTSKSSQNQSDVVWLNSNKYSFSEFKKPLCEYTGDNGVTIRSYSSLYSTADKLKSVYDELMNNSTGEEISYLSHVDLIGDYPYGRGIAGKWYGMWENGTLAKGRYIEIYGCDSISFTELARVLSHEYGHHFTYYYLNKKEHITSSNIMSSVFAKIRNLISYKDINDGEHMWDPAEIAAEDYTQLFGSQTGKKSMIFEDVRDQAVNNDVHTESYTSLVYNYSPQENFEIPLAWQVPGLYKYWSDLSGVAAKNATAPSAPILALVRADNQQLNLKWTRSIDDNTQDMEYTLVCQKADGTLLGIRTTTDSKGRDAVIGTYNAGGYIVKDSFFSSDITLRVYAKDNDGNIVRSNDLYIDHNDPQKSVTLLPNRIGGFDRYETSVYISQAGWPNGADTAVLATGDDFPDALSAAPLARSKNAPVLLTNANELDKRVDKELDRLKIKNVIIIGGTAAVSPAIESYLKSKGIICTRIAGKDRYDTSVEVAKAIGNFNAIALATGQDFPDALSIAPYAASSGIPIILTQKSILPDSVKEFLQEKNITAEYVIGGPSVIDDSVLSELKGAVRISGYDRYATNIAIVKRFQNGFNMSNIYLATGEDFPDALSGAALASIYKSFVFLISDNSFENVKDYILPAESKIKSINVLGGSSVITADTVMKTILQ